MKIQSFYFTISMTYVHKNKLYEAFYEFVRSLDCTLITSPEELNKFKRKIRDKKATLEKKHSRCKPINLDFYKHDPNGVEVVKCSSFHADIHPIKQVI